jgi:hypothetical protein
MINSINLNVFFWSYGLSDFREFVRSLGAKKIPSNSSNKSIGSIENFQEPERLSGFQESQISNDHEQT